MSMRFTQLQCKEVICVSDGRRHEACGNEADVLANVDPEQSAGLVRDFREALRVDGERPRRQGG